MFPDEDGQELIESIFELRAFKTGFRAWNIYHSNRFALEIMDLHMVKMAMESLIWLMSANSARLEAAGYHFEPVAFDLYWCL